MATHDRRHANAFLSVIASVAWSVFVFPGSSIANPIGLTTTASFMAFAHACSRVGTQSALCDETFTDPLIFHGIAAARASGTASFGELQASARFSFVLGQNGFPVARATATFQDDLTVTGSSGTGLIQYTFSGHIESITDPGGIGNGFQFSSAGSPLAGIQINHIQNTVEDFTYTSALLPFTWDSPFSLFVYAQGSTQLSPGDGGGRGSTAVRLDRLTVFDASGRPLDPHSYAVQSAGVGRNLNVDPQGVPYVPEPATLVLLGSGLVLVAWRRRGAGR